MIVKYDDKENIAFVDEPLAKEIVRTIECKPPIVQKVVFHRTATINDETCSLEGYSEWETENGAWDRVEIPKREGYNVFPKVIEFKEVNANTENETVFVKYEADFERIELNKFKPYAQRKEKPLLPPVEEHEEVKESEEVKNFVGVEIKKDKPYAQRKEKPLLPPVEEHEEVKESEEVKNFVGVEIKKDKPYAQRKEKPQLPSVEEHEEIENVKENEENKSDESSVFDALSSEFKEKTLKHIAETVKPETTNEEKKAKLETTNEESKTDSETLLSAKEVSLNKARQNLLSKQHEKNKQKEAFRNYQQRKYHEKMNAHVRNTRMQKPIQINDIGRFSAETIGFLNELKEIGEETLTREKWKVTLFAK